MALPVSSVSAIVSLFILSGCLSSADPGADRPTPPSKPLTKQELESLRIEQISALLSNPWVDDHTKQLALDLITPHIIYDAGGNPWLYRFGQPPQRILPTR